MITEYCVACGNTDSLENHHLVPKSCEGSDDDNNLLTLCFECHGNIHGMLRKDIAELTRAGLKRAKERGVKLGRPYIEGTDPFAGKAGEGRVASLAGRAANAKAKALDIAPIVLALKDQGVSLNQIAVELGRRGISTARGGNEWTATGVKRILKRFNETSKVDSPIEQNASRDGSATIT